MLPSIQRAISQAAPRFAGRCVVTIAKTTKACAGCAQVVSHQGYAGNHAHQGLPPAERGKTSRHASSRRSWHRNRRTEPLPRARWSPPGGAGRCLGRPERRPPQAQRSRRWACWRFTRVVSRPAPPRMVSSRLNRARQDGRGTDLGGGDNAAWVTAPALSAVRLWPLARCTRLQTLTSFPLCNLFRGLNGIRRQ